MCSAWSVRTCNDSQCKPWWTGRSLEPSTSEASTFHPTSSSWTKVKFNSGSPPITCVAFQSFYARVSKWRCRERKVKGRFADVENKPKLLMIGLDALVEIYPFPRLVDILLASCVARTCTLVDHHNDCGGPRSGPRPEGPSIACETHELNLAS